MKQKQTDCNDQEKKYHIAGWLLFIVCAVLFIAASLKNGDMLTFIASLFFLIACILFLIPLTVRRKTEKSSQEKISV